MDLQVIHDLAVQVSPARRGRPEVVALTVLDEDTARPFWDLYLQSFGPLRTRAAARQVLHEAEFFAEMTDHRVWKYVARDEQGRAIGLTTLTRDLETVPWISPEYYQGRYPSHFARQAVYYLGFTLVKRGSRNVLSFAAMIEAVVERLRADRAVCGYDICAFNNEAMRFAENIEAMLNRDGLVPVERLDSQTYYVADLSTG
ncbi:MAG: uncharacterized protein JWL64_2340 [Frankiales bacterium]|nr:uncharacterized protein [Frankiales bacterium]